MTLQQTAEIITKWISSCETTEQLDLLTEIIEKFVVERFPTEQNPDKPKHPITDKQEKVFVMEELKYEWTERKVYVAWKNSKALKK